jgi:hypothetical protein
MTTNNTFSNQKRDENNTFCNLTDLGKKGELKTGWYYVSRNNNIEMLEYVGDYFLSGDVPLIDDKDVSALEVLAPVPSYDHFVELTEKVKENQKLKELLKECRYKIIADLDKARLCKSSVDIEDFEYMLNRIDGVLK